MAQSVDTLVLDASIGIKWHLADEEDSDVAQELLRQYQRGGVGLVAPMHIQYEVFNALLVASRLQRPRLTHQEAIAATEEFLRLAIPTVTDDALLRAARAISYRWACAFYDGLYLALAERLDLRLITAAHPLVLWITDYG